MKKFNMWRIALVVILCSTWSVLSAQALLDRKVSLNVTRQRLDHTLEIISNQANFYFSYNSNIIRSDTLVSVQAVNKSIREVLQRLLGEQFEFRESGNYIILRRIPITVSVVSSSTTTAEKYYSVYGYVVDEQTGQRISDASVYEKDRLAVASTNTSGYFNLKLKSRFKKASITVSKEYYDDTTVSIRSGMNQQLLITLLPSQITERTTIIGPAGYEPPPSIDLVIPLSDSARRIYRYVQKDSFVVEKTAVGKWLLSSRQRLQSINLNKFFVARPYQVSIVPGISSNGKLNSQVVNSISLNVFGGYSGGTHGFEIGGLFNLDKRHVKYAQVGGVLNLVGGDVDGAQVAGVSNTVLGNVSGVQAGGVANYGGGNITGVQLAGVYNHSGASTMGAQVAGVVNFTNRSTKGAQIAGVANISSREVKGVQIAGVFNYTRRLKGVQIGLINVSDTSSGFSIGLINIVYKGYHKLSLYANEVIDANASFKTGNSKLYSILLAGYNLQPDQKLWTFGYGLGSELIGTRRFAMNLDLTAQQLHRGSWEHYNILSRAGLQFNFKFGKNFSVFAGPAYNVYVSNQDFDLPGYKAGIPPARYKLHSLGNDVTGWIGWSAGVNIF